MRQTNAAAITKNTAPANPCSGSIRLLLKVFLYVM
jgi:hypothetical protein